MTEPIKSPTAFISYSGESLDHKNWVRELASRLRIEGIDVMLDQWDLRLGDPLPEFMERGVRENDFVLLVCTPNFKAKADGRQGGVGYEGNIMTGELFIKYNHRKFIPVLRHDNWAEAAPAWLQAKTYIDLTDKRFEENFEELLRTLHGENPDAPPLGKRRSENERNTNIEKLRDFQEQLEKRNKDSADGIQLLNKFAEKWAEEAEHNQGALVNFVTLAEEIKDCNLIQAVKEVEKEIINGAEYHIAFAKRPDIFSPEFIGAIKASDKDGDRVKHLQIFLKNRK